MLRLKPSELTLTPDDVDETLQRMARRQQSRAAAPSYRRTRNSGRPAVPRLMPGAQRSVRDSITSLGNIPILRPSPQQAVIAHVDDDDSEASNESLDEPSHRAKSSPDPLRAHSQHGQSLSASAASPSRRTSRLPFRLVRSRRSSETEQQLHSSPREQNEDSDGTLVEPTSLPVETTNVASPATPGRCQPTVTPFAEQSPTTQPNYSTTPASLRGGASRFHEDRVRSVGQQSIHALSPLRRAQMPGTTHQTDNVSTTADEETTVRYLKGYFERASHKYTFEELVPLAPHTEPVRKTSQQQLHSRSHSSTDAPPPRFFTPSSTLSGTSTGEDVFWTPAAPTIAQAAGGRDGRLRQHSSEMSNTSLAYSYYELPETRQSSGDQPVQSYDGFGTSRETSRGTYRSIRLSEAQALGSSVPRPPIRGTSGLALQAPILPGQLGLSPLPAEPYRRMYGGGVEMDCQPAMHHRVSQESLGHDHYPNAVTAALENRVSPLEALTTQMGRESQRLGVQSGHHLIHGQIAARQSGHPHAGYIPSPHDPQQSLYVPHTSPYGPYSSPYGLQPSAYSHQPGLVGHTQGALAPMPMAMADDPYTRGVSANVGRHNGPTARPPSAQPVPVADHAPQPLPRSSHGGRSGQRSSENASVEVSLQDARTARSQVQNQVSAFEQLQSAVPPRRPRQRRERVEAPQVSAPQRNELLSSPMPTSLPRMPPRHRPRQRAALSPSQGNAERRSTRMDPRLRDQENSGEAEMEMMRQELDAVRARYNETQQGDVMDETPPRIGRVERHM